MASLLRTGICWWTGTILVLLTVLPGVAQERSPAADSLTVVDIRLSGNRQTRREIILREVAFVPGERVALSDIEPRRAETQRLLSNTGLFLYTEVDLCDTAPDSFSLCIRVQEAWYFFPVLIFELADRNINVWWQDFQGSLDRVNYGIYLNHFNPLGRRDLLKIKYQHGYTRKHEFSYEMAQLPGSTRWGAGIQASYLRNHEVQYSSARDRQVFHRDDSRWMLRRALIGGYATYRPGTLWQHRFGLAYRDVQTDPSVQEGLNPGYFTGSDSRLRYFVLYSSSRFDRLDDRPYPFKGRALQVDMVKEGLALAGRRERWWIAGEGQVYIPTGPGNGWESVFRWRLHLQRENMGFFEYQALGFGDEVLRGYERYVIDGLDYALWRNAWRQTLLSRQQPLPLPRWAFLDKVRLMPIQVYGKVYADQGYVYDPFMADTHRLRNRWLASAGVGIDLRVYFDKILSLMWSFNQLGENGLFLQTKIGIR